MFSSQEMHNLIRDTQYDNVHSSQTPLFGGGPGSCVPGDSVAPGTKENEQPSLIGAGIETINSATAQKTAKPFSSGSRHVDVLLETTSNRPAPAICVGGRLPKNGVGPFGKTWMNGLWIARKRRELANIDSLLATAFEPKASEKSAVKGTPLADVFEKSVGLRPIFLEDLSVTDVKDVMASVDFLIGTTGAGFTNQIFMRPGSKVVVITCSACFPVDVSKNLMWPDKPHGLASPYFGLHVLYYVVDIPFQLLKLRGDGHIVETSLGIFGTETEAIVPRTLAPRP